MNKIKAAALAAVVGAAVAFPTVSLAQMSMKGPDSGRYVGGNVGLAEVDELGEDDMSFKILGGYQINRNFGVELGYTDFGKVSVAPGIDVKGNAIELVGVGTLPLNDKFSLIGKLGFAMRRVQGRRRIGRQHRTDLRHRRAVQPQPGVRPARRVAGLYGRRRRCVGRQRHEHRRDLPLQISATAVLQGRAASAALFFLAYSSRPVSVETDRLISAKPSSQQEEQIERSLRPATLAEYVGQEKVRGQLEIFIAGGARARRGARPRAAVRPAGAGQDHARAHHRARDGRQPAPDLRPGARARRRPRRASSPTSSRATCCSSTRSTASRRWSRRSSTRRWRTTRSTS